MVQEDGHRTRPTLNPDERQQIQQANQIFLRLRKELHDRERQPDERDIRQAVQGAQWLSEIVERHSEGLEQAYEDALSESGLPDEDQAYLWKETKEAGGLSSFVLRDLQRLEEAALGEGEQPGEPTASIARRDLMRAVVAGLLAGGTMMGNSFYFGFGIGMSRKSEC